jgi:GTPase SAR1 family protein
MVLVGNKIDLPRQVTTDEGRKLAEYYKLPFFETSAKESINITESIKRLITEVLVEFQNKERIKLKNEVQNDNTSICKC